VREERGDTLDGIAPFLGVYLTWHDIGSLS